MPIYVGAVLGFGMLIHFLLIMGTNQLFYFQSNIKNALIAAVLGGLYAGACLLPRLDFLANPLFRILCLLCMSLIAFDCSTDGIRRMVVFAGLSLAINGISQGQGTLNPWPLLIASILAIILILTGAPLLSGGNHYVPVELSYGKIKLNLTALRDTGNMLRDPVTGKPVLVVGADAAQELTGLTVQQLRQPVETIGTIPGLRLIPYKAIGGSGLLLALRISNVRIGSWRGSSLVAFAPEVLNVKGTYQALTGGMV